MFLFFRKQVTSRSNSAAIILRLETVGDAGDVIDRELEKGTRLPGTIRLYLSRLIKFLEWVSGNSTWLRHLRLSSSVVLTLCRSLVNVKGILSEDVNADMVAR